MQNLVLEHRMVCPCHEEESYVYHGDDTMRLIRTPILVPDERSWVRRLVDRLWPVSD